MRDTPAVVCAPHREFYLEYAEEVGEALGIPETVTQLACIPTAYYTGDDFKVAARGPAEQITYWNQWKNTQAD